MIQVEEAQRILLERCRQLPDEHVLALNAAGQVLREDVAGDVDSPPFDKALVDGYAVRAADATAGSVLQVVGTLVAGQVPEVPLAPRQALRIMTGAPLPPGADAVVMLERTQPVSPNEIRISQTDVAPGLNILAQGASMRRGDVVLKVGTVLRPLEIGLLAELGRTSVRVVRRPHVAILATGDELVEPDQAPGPGQIRNSNGTLLAALLENSGARVRLSAVAPDDPARLLPLVRSGLTSDLLLITGGVSTGDRDYIPSVLKDAGVQQLFHGVDLKPGKPIWCGVLEDGQRQCWVFGLPGNPVSCLVCFELFVRPVVDLLAGRGDRRADRLASARLAVAFEHQADRITYHPAVLDRPTGDVEDPFALRVYPVTWKGSADLRSLVAANALLILPRGAVRWEAGRQVNVYKFGFESSI